MYTRSLLLCMQAFICTVRSDTSVHCNSLCYKRQFQTQARNQIGKHMHAHPYTVILCAMPNKQHFHHSSKAAVCVEDGWNHKGVVKVVTDPKGPPGPDLSIQRVVNTQVTSQIHVAVSLEVTTGIQGYCLWGNCPRGLCDFQVCLPLKSDPSGSIFSKTTGGPPRSFHMKPLSAWQKPTLLTHLISHFIERTADATLHYQACLISPVDLGN
jgi:hypothetical protein